MGSVFGVGTGRTKGADVVGREGWTGREAMYDGTMLVVVVDEEVG